MSSGFKHDPLADINELAQVLGDQYDAASIPKELIQNADDADAKTLHFSWATAAGGAEDSLVATGSKQCSTERAVRGPGQGSNAESESEDDCRPAGLTHLRACAPRRGRRCTNTSGWPKIVPTRWGRDGATGGRARARIGVTKVAHYLGYWRRNATHVPA